MTVSTPKPPDFGEDTSYIFEYEFPTGGLYSPRDMYPLTGTFSLIIEGIAATASNIIVNRATSLPAAYYELYFGGSGSSPQDVPLPDIVSATYTAGPPLVTLAGTNFSPPGSSGTVIYWQDPVTLVYAVVVPGSLTDTNAAISAGQLTNLASGTGTIVLHNGFGYDTYANISGTGSSPPDATPPIGGLPPFPNTGPPLPGGGPATSVPTISSIENNTTSGLITITGTNFTGTDLHIFWGGREITSFTSNGTEIRVNANLLTAPPIDGTAQITVFNGAGYTSAAVPASGTTSTGSPAGTPGTPSNVVPDIFSVTNSGGTVTIVGDWFTFGPPPHFVYWTGVEVPTVTYTRTAVTLLAASLAPPPDNILQITVYNGYGFDAAIVPITGTLADPRGDGSFGQPALASLPPSITSISNNGVTVTITGANLDESGQALYWPLAPLAQVDVSGSATFSPTVITIPTASLVPAPDGDLRILTTNDAGWAYGIVPLTGTSFITGGGLQPNVPTNPPTISNVTRISPTSIRITGTNFGGPISLFWPDTVTPGNAVGFYTVISPTEIVVPYSSLATPAPDGVTAIVVANAAGSATGVVPAQTGSPPDIASVSNDGVTVTINGANFAGASLVWTSTIRTLTFFPGGVGGSNSGTVITVPVTVFSSGHPIDGASAIIVATADGWDDNVVPTSGTSTVGGGPQTGPQEAAAAPTIASVTNTGGTVTITGTNFVGALTISWPDAPPQSTIVPATRTPTQITFPTPTPDPDNELRVSVRNSKGVATAVIPDEATVGAVQIASIEVIAGNVVLHGSGFAGATVTWPASEGSPITPALSTNTNTEIRIPYNALVPEIPDGSLALLVANGSSFATAVVPAAAISAGITPLGTSGTGTGAATGPPTITGVTNAGGVITITGTNLGGAFTLSQNNPTEGGPPINIPGGTPNSSGTAITIPSYALTGDPRTVDIFLTVTNSEGSATSTIAVPPAGLTDEEIEALRAALARAERDHRTATIVSTFSVSALTIAVIAIILVVLLSGKSR